jgi:ketosteroid isomerase-like protein
MNRLRVHLRFAAVMLLAVVAPAFASEAGAPAVESAWVAAMKANDLEAVMRTYADDAVAWLPDEIEARGTVAIRAQYVGLLGTFTVTEVALTDTGHWTAGKTSVGWGKFSLTLTPKAGGEPVVMKGRFTDMAEERDGRWVYTLDHASAEPEPKKPAESADTPAAGT